VLRVIMRRQITDKMEKKMFAYIQNPVSKEALFLHSIEYETHQTIHAEKWTSASSMFRLT